MSRRVAVIGATGTIGSAITRALAQSGRTLGLVARNRVALESLASTLPPSAAACCVAAELGSADGPSAISAALLAAGPVDDLVISVGPFVQTPIQSLSGEQLASAFCVHAAGPMLLVRELRDSLRAGRGCVVAISDQGVHTPYPHHAAYLAAKGALDAGMRALATALAPEVRVNVLRVGIVSDRSEGGLDGRQGRLASRSLSGRFGTPEEVAHVVIAMIESSWVLGQAWTVG